jgi:pimeloyl-ACP methyl ester carboxylesterase
MMQKPHLEENFKKIVREDLTGAVKAVRQNTLILWGKDDTYVPITDASLLHEYIDHSILSVFPGIGHDLPLRHSEDIVSSIHTFLTTKTVE